jgi:hypothetical protein
MLDNGSGYNIDPNEYSKRTGKKVFTKASKGTKNIYNATKNLGKAKNIGKTKVPPKDTKKSNTNLASGGGDNTSTDYDPSVTNPGNYYNPNALNDYANVANERDRLAARQNRMLKLDTQKRIDNAKELAYSNDDLFLAAKQGMLHSPELTRAVMTRNMDSATGDLSPIMYKDAGIDLNSIAGIIGLPYMADNIVDPPPIWDASELSESLNSWDSGRCGKDFTKRVLERGQFLVLMPIELRPNITDTVGLALSGATGGLTSGFINGVIKSLDSVEQRLNVSSYGFTAKIASKRYWRSVQAHAKAIFYSLGIDDFDYSVFSGPNYDKKMEKMKRYLPDYLVDNVYATNDMQMTLTNLKEGKDADGASELKEYEAAVKSAGSISDEAKDNTEKNTSDPDNVVGTLSTFRNAIGGLVGGIGNSIKDNLTSNSLEYTSDEKAQSDLENNYAGVKAMYSDSMMTKLIYYIMNTDPQDARLKTMPYTVFYCNGPIDRSYNWNIETNTSKIGEHAILGTKKKLKGAIGGMISSGLSTLVGSPSSDSGQTGQTGGKEAVSEISDAMDPMSDMMNEWAYHNSGRTMGAFLINNLYVPKVQSGGSSQFSYTVPIRDMALSSDRYSLARLHFTTALLMPYVYQTTFPRQALIIPSSALYCAAFSKGVMNCPRAVISNMSIKTDNAFQTTFGVPTELDITLTIEPLYTVATTPDFNKYWAVQNHPEYFLGAMWNPMSSINVLATMCGQNTVFSKMPVGLFEFFISGNAGRIRDTIIGSYASFRASVRDYSATLGLSANSYKMI